MHSYEDVLIEDVLGGLYSLTACDLLCRRDGDMDYSDPVAAILPDGVTIINLLDGEFQTFRGEPVSYDDIDWSIPDEEE